MLQSPSRMEIAPTPTTIATVSLVDPQKLAELEAKKLLRPNLLPRTHQSQRAMLIKLLMLAKMPRLLMMLKLLPPQKLKTRKLRPNN